MSAGMRAEIIAAEGPAAAWDRQDQARFRELAGERFLRVGDDGSAIVLTADGRETTIYPGWLVILPEDGPQAGRPLFDAPDRVRVKPAGS
jgi:hypothetical protein